MSLVFSFYDVFLQRGLNEVVTTWNAHRIRHRKNQRAPHGRPFAMFNMPEIYGRVNCRVPVEESKIQCCDEECTKMAAIPCDETVFEMCCSLMEQYDWRYPTTALSAVVLYLDLRQKILTVL